MAENYEFIAAKDLPATEAEEVDVLCVDPTTGAMARKPGASFGGGAGGYVIKVPASEFDMETGEGTISESYDNFADILFNGGNVVVDMSETFAALGLFGITRVTPIMYMYSDDGSSSKLFQLICLNPDSGTPFMFAFPNGTWTPPEE